MTDEASTRIFKGVRKRPGGPTRVLGGRVVEVDANLVKVQMQDGLEPVWVPADGVTAINAEAEFPVGTDQRPLSLARTTRMPYGAPIKFVGATGRTILGHKLLIDQTIQELEAARKRLEAMDVALVDAAQFLPVSEAAPTPEDEAPVGAIWRQVDEAGTVVAKWVRTAEGWDTFTGAVVQAETLAASIGVFIDAMMENLTVTGAANISEAAVDELTARIASILTLNAEQVNVGRDARFFSGGLVFYAPPADGQDPTDWENRQPLIGITPTGTVSIAVAQDGDVTAGITPEGTVWGKAGGFDTLTVGGYPLDVLLNRGPLGVLAMTRINNNAPISNVANTVASVRAQLHTGRMYKVEYALGMSRTTGDIRVDTYAVWGTNSVRLATKSQGFDGEFTAPVDFTADEYSIPDGTDVEIQCRLRTVSSGATGTLWGYGADKGGMPSIKLRDDGQAPAIYEVAAGQPPAPPAQWYGPDAVTSGTGWGVRPDGSNAPDARLTLGGYNIYGSDMAEDLVYPIDLSRLNGAIVRSAQIVVTCTQNAPVAFAVFASNGPTGGVNIYNGTVGSNGQFICDIPASLHQNLVGKSSIILRPFYPGSTASYGSFAANVTANLIYSR